MLWLTFLLLSVLLLLGLDPFGLLEVGGVPAATALARALVLRVRELLFTGYPLVVSTDCKVKGTPL